MKNNILFTLLCATACAQVQYDNAVATGSVDNPSLDEISGMFGMRKPGNEDCIVTVHDSDAENMFVLNLDGSLNSKIDLVGDDWRDAEEMIGYTDSVTGKNYLILCEFGDNPASRDKKYLFRFEEPTITGEDIAITDFDKIAYRLPSNITLEKGTNRGDFEGAFACPVDGKIYMFSKRMPVNYIFSLPIQDEYIGTQTLTFEGTMHPDVEQEFGGVISPANCVGAALSRDCNHALIKTYKKVYQFVRPEGRTWADVLVNDAPTLEDNYVGRGAAPEQEPQGESITYRAFDQGYLTVSEFRGNNEVPMFYYPTLEVESKPFIAKGFRRDGVTNRILVENLPNLFWIEYTTDLKIWTKLDVIVTVEPDMIIFDHLLLNDKCFYRVGFETNQ